MHSKPEDTVWLASSFVMPELQPSPNNKQLSMLRNVKILSKKMKHFKQKTISKPSIKLLPWILKSKEKSPENISPTKKSMRILKMICEDSPV